jgi:HD-like signal output (HDOD) protein
MTDIQKTSPSSAKLSEIFAKMNMSELPAMSPNVQELISLTSSTRSSGGELTRVILKDFSLTNKVLQIVNSAYYSLGRACNSISKAVTILGFDAIRDMAMAIALFEDFVKSGADKEGLSKLLTRSFLSGLQARDLVVENGLNISPEETFICSLLHNLGKIIVNIYLPDKYREIEAKMISGSSPNAACRAVLSDLTFPEIGAEVAKFWNLSENVIESMGDNPDAPKHKYDTLGFLQNVTNFANSFVDSVCDGTDLGPVFQRYGGLLSVDADQAIKNLNQCIEVSEDISESIRFGMTRLKIRARLRNVEANAKRGIFNSDRPEEQQGRVRSVVAEEDDRCESLPEDMSELPSSPDKSVNDFIRDLTEALMGPLDLNGFYANLLEALYRGVGFDRVILSIVSVQPNKVALMGRFGLGEIDPAGVKKFEHVLTPGPYVIPNALKLGKDMMIPANKADAFPDDLNYLVKDRTVYLFPICIDNKGIGMIYLDRKASRPLLDKTMIKNVRLFRDFAVMAIRKIRKGG